MSGGITAIGTALAVGSAVTGSGALIAGLGAGLVGGMMGNASYRNNKKQIAMQKQGLEQQKNAQNQALQQAESQKSASQQAYNRANQKTADASSILKNERSDSSTLLTGNDGVSKDKLKLSKKSLLGG